MFQVAVNEISPRVQIAMEEVNLNELTILAPVIRHQAIVLLSTTA